MERSDTRWRSRSRPRADTFERVGDEYCGADQTHHRSHCLEHCKTSFAPLARAEDGGDLAQSKRFRSAPAQSVGTEDSLQQVFQKEAAKTPQRPVNQRKLHATIDSPPRGPPHFRRLPVAISSHVDADGGPYRSERPVTVRIGQASGAMVIGANGDPALRFGGSGGAVRSCRRPVSCARQLRLVGQVRQPC